MYVRIKSCWSSSLSSMKLWNPTPTTHSNLHFICSSRCAHYMPEKVWRFIHMPFLYDIMVMFGISKNIESTCGWTRDISSLSCPRKWKSDLLIEDLDFSYVMDRSSPSKKPLFKLRRKWSMRNLLKSCFLNTSAKHVSTKHEK